jgi:hypothetical protein
LFRARKPAPAAHPKQKAKAGRSEDHTFFWDHLNELQVFDARVLAWDSKQQRCRLAELNACLSDRKIPLSGEIDARLWEVPVSPGQRICFSAYCSQRWDDSQGRVPFLNFDQLIRVYSGKKKRKTGGWHWSAHARQRQAQRMIPDDVVHFVLNHGISWQEKKRRIFRMPENWQDFPKAKAWRKLQVITEGETIITLFLCCKPMPGQGLTQRLESSLSG